LGIDIGGTNIKYGLYDKKGNTLDAGGSKDTVRDDLDVLLNSIDEVVQKYDQIDGIGISVPGGIDKQTGIIFEGGAIRSLDRVDLRSILIKKYGFPVTIENDANCATLAEKWLGNGKDCETFVCVTVGTGIGGGMMIGGRLHDGHKNWAGEFGYIRIPAKDSKKVSLSETSTWMLMEHLKEMGYTLTGKEFFDRLDDDTALYDVYLDWIDRLAEGIFNIHVIIDPQRILIGGGISAQTRIYTDIKASLAKIIKISYYLKDIEIMPCYFHNDAGKVGAIYKLINQGVIEQ